MSKLEDPFDFDIKKNFSGIEVVYSNLMEICQGGPEIGTLSINGHCLSEYQFGGPILITRDYIIAPIYVKKFIVSGFMLSKINLRDLSVEIFGKIKDLIFLDKIEKNRVYYFEDLNKSLSRFHDF